MLCWAAPGTALSSPLFRCAWATVAARSRSWAAAEHLRGLLDPYVDLVCFNGAWVVGSVALFHGMLGHALGDRRGAEDKLQTALRMHKRLDAAARGAHTGDDGEGRQMTA